MLVAAYVVGAARLPYGCVDNRRLMKERVSLSIVLALFLEKNARRVVILRKSQWNIFEKNWTRYVEGVTWR
jgi:hypothetical protein